MTKRIAVTDFDRWEASVASVFCPTEINVASKGKGFPFSGELADTALNRIHLARIGSNAVDVYRRKSHIGQVSDGCYLVKFQLQGRGLVQQRGRQAFLRPGDFVMCTATDPYELHFPEQYRQAILVVPQGTLTEMFSATDDYLGVRMGSENPTHSLLSSFVLNMVQRIDLLEPSIVQRLEANILDLLVTSLHALAGQHPENAHVAPIAEHLQAIKRHISLNLRNPNLTPDFIAKKTGVSKRYLHMVFQAEDVSVSRYIQHQRLEACRRTLASPAMRHLSTTDIALEWGFSDASHFHRCFKACFGTTPRNYRLQATAR